MYDGITERAEGVYEGARDTEGAATLGRALEYDFPKLGLAEGANEREPPELDDRGTLNDRGALKDLDDPEDRGALKDLDAPEDLGALNDRPPPLRDGEKDRPPPPDMREDPNEPPLDPRACACCSGSVKAVRIAVSTKVL